MTSLCFWQLEQAQAGTLAFPLHMDYHWGHSMEHGFDSEEEEEEEKVGLALSPLDCTRQEPYWACCGKRKAELWKPR